MATFKEAFREARAGGGKTFEWNGKKYTTDLASDKPSKSDDSNDKVTASKVKAGSMGETAYNARTKASEAKGAANREAAAEKQRESRGTEESMGERLGLTTRKKLPEGNAGGMTAMKQGGLVRRGYGKARGA